MHETYMIYFSFCQFDFQSQTLCSIQHGTKTKKVKFTDVTGYQSEVSCGGSIPRDISNSEFNLVIRLFGWWYMYIIDPVLDELPN